MNGNLVHDVALLPDDIRRTIIRFLPRNHTAKIINSSFSKVELKYVRKYRFTVNTISVWNDLKPSSLQSVHYGDGKQFRRASISKGEYIRLSKLGIMPSGVRFW